MWNKKSEVHKEGDVSYFSMIRSFDLDRKLRRALFAMLFSFAPAVVLLVLLFVFFPEIEPIPRIIGYVLTTVVVLASFILSLDYVAVRLEPLLFPRKHQLQMAMKKISGKLGRVTSFREMKEVVLVEIVDTLQVFGSAIVLHYQDKLETISVGEIDPVEVERLIKTETWNGHDRYSCFPIGANEEYCSYLIVTQNRARSLPILEEREWLQLIISYLSISMENIYLIHTLTNRLQLLASGSSGDSASDEFVWFRRLMFELQEKERVRIATELHDTTLQDLFFLKRRLSGLMEQQKLDNAVSAKIKDMIHYIEVINENLRQSCFELHPYLLQEAGLIKAVQKVVEMELSVNTFDIVLTVSGAAAYEAADFETKRHVFRIVQELLNNAKKHSNAKVVKLRLVSEDNKLSIWYEDDGVGFDPSIASTRGGGGTGAGLEQLKTRIVALNARLNIETAHGKGVVIVITIPMKDKVSA